MLRQDYTISARLYGVLQGGDRVLSVLEELESVQCKACVALSHEGALLMVPGKHETDDLCH